MPWRHSSVLSWSLECKWFWLIILITTSCTIIAVDSLFMMIYMLIGQVHSLGPNGQYVSFLLWYIGWKTIFHSMNHLFKAFQTIILMWNMQSLVNFVLILIIAIFSYLFFRPSQNYHISAGKEPVTLELLTFLRIFCMRDCKCSEESDMKVKFALVNTCIARRQDFCSTKTTFYVSRE